MYRRPPPRLRRDLQRGHEALHDRKAHAAALGAAGREHGRAGLFDVLHPAALVAHDNVEDAVRQDAAADGHEADRIAVGVDDAVGDRLGDGGLDIVQLLEIRVELRGKAGDGRAGKGLVGGPAGEGQRHFIFSFHGPDSFHLPRLRCARSRRPGAPSSAAAAHF